MDLVFDNIDYEGNYKITKEHLEDFVNRGVPLELYMSDTEHVKLSYVGRRDPIRGKIKVEMSLKNGNGTTMDFVVPAAGVVTQIRNYISRYDSLTRTPNHM